MKAGIARLDITPPFGMPVDGYFEKRYGKGVLDPLELNAIAVSDNDKTVIMIAADLIGVGMKDCELIKERIGKALNIEKDYVFISALHQHTSLRLVHQTDRYHISDFYAEMLYCKFCDVAKMAVDDMDDADISTAQAETSEQIAFVRRYRLKDGSVATNPRPHQIKDIVGSCEEPDNTVRLIRFTRKEKKDIALVNFSTHPDVIGGEKYSADWCGFVRRFVEADNSDVFCIFFTGAQGDSNHVNFMGEIKTGYSHSRHMGRVIADAVKSVWDSAEPHSEGKIFAKVRSVFNMTKTEGADKYDDAVSFFEDYHAGKADPNTSMATLGNYGRILRIREQPIFRELPVSLIAIGDIIIVGFAGEAFTAYANEVRAAAGDRFALTFVLTNGSQGYLPSASAFEEGGYESSSSNFTPNLMDQAISAVKELIDEI